MSVEREREKKTRGVTDEGGKRRGRDGRGGGGG